jgi:transglutaminase-like putative cysteine protease
LGLNQTGALEGTGSNLLNATDRTAPILADWNGTPTEGQFSTDSFRSFVRDPKFRVDTNDPTFWRTTSYENYEIGGFEKSGGLPGLTDVGENMPAALRGNPTETNRFTLETNASRLPTAPYPKSATIIDTPSVDSDNYNIKQTRDGTLVVTDTNGKIAELPVGSEYKVESTQTDWSMEELNSTTLNPGPIADRYTETLSGDPGRVGELANNITTNADAETRYEKTEAVTEWLRSNKDYRVNASARTVDDFLFKNEGGHSEHFASSATALLREEGVPARYVTGYTEGERNGTDVNTVGSMDQHAWTEVYFGDKGWVRVDPTPAADRERVTKAVKHGSDSASKYGVSDDIIDAWRSGDPAITGGQSSNPPSANEPPGGFEGIPPAPYNISVNPDPTPGGDVIVTITKNGTEIPNAEVEFNDESIGRTDRIGTVKATVPYAPELTITVTPPPNANDNVQSLQLFETSGVPIAPGSAYASVQAPQLATQPDKNETNGPSSRTYELPTDVKVGTGQYAFPGETVTATFTINNTAVPSADVYLNGARVGETNDNGRAAITISKTAEPGERVQIRVERDALVSQTGINVAKVDVTVDPNYVPLPVTPATVTVTAVHDGQKHPITNASVTLRKTASINGPAFQTGETDTNGTFAMTLPWSNDVSATAVKGPVTVSGVLNGMYYWVGGVLFAVAALIGGVVYALHKRGLSVGDLKQRAVDLLFKAAEIITHTGERIAALVERAREHAVQALNSLRDGITVNKAKHAVVWVAMLLLDPAVRLYELFHRLYDRLRDLFDAPDADADSNSTFGTTAGYPDMGEATDQVGSPSAYARLLQSWRWLVRFVVGRVGASRRTAVEVSDAAVDRGLPVGAVTRLRRAFQDVEYGTSDAEKRVETAESAISELRTTTDDIEEAD